jgi:hypothetical protein
MKLNSFSSGLLGLSAAVLIATLSFSAQAAQQGTARVTRLHGMARYSTGNNVWLPVSVGTILKPGAVIQTASESSVDLVLSGEEGGRPSPVVNVNPGNIKTFSPGSDSLQNVVRLRENTLLAIDKLSWEQTGADTVTDTQLDLRAGTIFGNVKKSSAASRYEIKVPNGVAGIRGTLYSISANGVLTVYIGSVVVTYLNPKNPDETITKVVSAGQQYDMTTDSYINIPAGSRDSAQQQGQEMTGPETYYNQTTVYNEDHTITVVSPNEPVK